MPQAILVLLRHPEEAGSLLDAAARLADIMGLARINALAIGETIELTLAAATTLAGRSEAILAAKEDERLRVLDLKDLFAEWTARVANQAVDALWFEAEGSTTELVATWGQRADVIVATRPSPEDRVDREAFRMALLGTDRPVLMVPPLVVAAPNATFGRRIAIAWRDERQALRAVLASLRWLEGAEQVHVLIGVSDSTRNLDLPAVVLEHGIAASLHVLVVHPGSFGGRLLEAAHRLGADLLVMGAYAHRPLREMILGGVTHHMLSHADLPVLMRH